MIQHLVALALRADASAAELQEVMQGLADLRAHHAGWVSFQHGPNIDVENLSERFGYGFLCGFTDREALDRYAVDPRHKALGARLVSLCEDAAGSIMVIDLKTEGPTR